MRSFEAELELELRILVGIRVQLFEQQTRLDVVIVLVFVAHVLGDRTEIS